jgi:sortase A
MLVALAGTFAVSAIWIPAKAQVAQVLLHHAWLRARAGERAAKPWPWADTWPIGRLRAPRQRIDLIVLAGASGEALAFAPGHVDGTALPGRCGHCAVSAHRDTHFRFLAELEPGDPLELEAPDGRVQRFAVRAAWILDERRGEVLTDDGMPLLTLITCYPFDAIVPGGPLRYVVQAEVVEEACGRPERVSGGGCRVSQHD